MIRHKGKVGVVGHEGRRGKLGERADSSLFAICLETLMLAAIGYGVIL
jgi:hypothetical protein